MARTTLDIETPILKELKQIRKEEGGSLGNLVSRLLTDAIARRKARPAEAPSFQWNSQAMGALVDLADKEVVYTILDRSDRAAEP